MAFRPLNIQRLIYFKGIRPPKDNYRSTALTDCIMDYYDMNCLDIGQLLGIGCDGTATNAGVNVGIVRLLETK